MEVEGDTSLKAPVRNLESAKGITPDEYPGVDFCVLIDCTGSMGSYIQMAKNKIKDIIKQVKELYDKSEIRIGAVGYRDFNDTNMIEVFPFQDDADKARAFFDQLVANGGNDTPENVNGGFQKALYGLEWKNPVRIIIHIADAPCHGKEFHTTHDNYPNGHPTDKPWDEMLKDLAVNHIDYTFFKIHDITDQMFGKFKKMALAHGAEKFDCISINQSSTSGTTGGGGGGLFGTLGGGGGLSSAEDKFAALISEDIKASLANFLKKRKLEKRTGDFFITKLGMSSTELLSKFQEFNNRLLDRAVDIEEKKKIIDQIKEYLSGSIDSSSLAIKCGLFFGLAVLSKNVKTDEKTLESILQILANLTAGNTEDYTILVNEGAQELVIENLDKTLPDNICEGAIWNVANLAVESAPATELMVKIGCFDRVVDVYLAKLDSKLALLTSTTAWCIASFLHHNKLDEENRLKLIPVLKGMLEKENDDKETLDYISYSFNALLTSSRKIVEEMDKANIFKIIKDGFLRLDAKTPNDKILAFYKKVIEAMIEDKESYEILLKYLTDDEFFARLCTYSFELPLRAASIFAKLLSLFLSKSKEAVHKAIDKSTTVPQIYAKLYPPHGGENNNASPFIKLLRLLITKGDAKVRESIVTKENEVDCAYLKTIVRSLPTTAAADHETMLDFLKGLNALLKLAQTKKPDTITNGVKGSVHENRKLVKNFLEKQKDPELAAEVKNLYELLAIKNEEKKVATKADKIVEEKEEKKRGESKPKKASKKKDDLKENLPDEDLPNPLKKKLKRMTTMALTSLEASEFLDKPELNLRKTRHQTKLAAEKDMEDEDEAPKKPKKKKISKKKEIKISKALPDHPAFRRTKTMAETIAAANAFLKSNKKGRSAVSSLRSATKATKLLRRTRTMMDVIESGKVLQKNYGRGKREKEDVNYNELFMKKVRKE